MKVKLQYTVDMEDIPDELECLVKKALCHLAEASDAASNLDAAGNASKFVESANNAREKMLKADLLLADCTKIMSDYAATIHGGEELADEG